MDKDANRPRREPEVLKAMFEAEMGPAVRGLKEAADRQQAREKRRKQATRALREGRISFAEYVGQILGDE